MYEEYHFKICLCHVYEDNDSSIVNVIVRKGYSFKMVILMDKISKNRVEPAY